MSEENIIHMIDNIISRLLKATPNSINRENILKEDEIIFLCNTAKDIFMSQPIYLELSPPLYICGDLHGQYFDLLKLFNLGGSPDIESYLFLGDYVDRGKYSLETISLLLAYKIKYPECFFLLRGNHECAAISKQYGFFDECKRKYSIKLWKIFVECFNCFPIVASIDDKIICMHGGLSPEFNNLDQLNKIIRPTDIPEQGLLCDLLWSDPDRNTNDWEVNERGISLTFSKTNLKNFLKKNDMDLVCRGHQVVEQGYEFFGDKQLVTVFSAPNYCNQYDNSAALMHVDESLMCSFKILKASLSENTEEGIIYDKI